ncbi:MAG: hypothetical protein HOP09_03585 [Hyphomicrobium sp.]|nr:hypothetical protein [Hyphomicrobium sp.]
MDLKAANLADEKVWRWTRVSMIACFVVASVMLITSLAQAKNTELSFNQHVTLSSSSTH